MQSPKKIIIIEEKGGSFEKIEISDAENLQARIYRPKTLLGRIFLTIISLVLIVGIFYLAILFSVFLLLLFPVFGFISFLMMKFGRKKTL